MLSKLLKFGLLMGIIIVWGGLRARTLDDVVAIANPSVPTETLTTDQLKAIYTDKTRYWDGGQAVVIVVLADQTDAALQQASGMSASSFKTFWQRLAFSGRGQEPKKADDVASLVSLVASTKGAVALAPLGTTLAGVKKIEIK